LLFPLLLLHSWHVFVSWKPQQSSTPEAGLRQGGCSKQSVTWQSIGTGIDPPHGHIPPVFVVHCALQVLNFLNIVEADPIGIRSTKTVGRIPIELTEIVVPIEGSTIELWFTFPKFCEVHQGRLAKVEHSTRHALAPDGSYPS